MGNGTDGAVLAMTGARLLDGDGIAYARNGG
jgi:hypothetical protein